MLFILFLLLPPFQPADTLFSKAPADWKVEVIPFPLGFAPQIELTGREELRFDPEWSKPDSPSYFSYAFIWWLDGDITIDHAMLQKNLDLYYKGLYKAVSKTKGTDPTTFASSVRATRERAWIPGASANFRGTMKWVDPFFTEKPLTLNLMMCSWRCNGKTALFVLVSPQDSGHPIWQTLKELRAGACP